MTIKITQMNMHGRVFIEFQDRCIKPLCHYSSRRWLLTFDDVTKGFNGLFFRKKYYKYVTTGYMGPIWGWWKSIVFCNYACCSTAHLASILHVSNRKRLLGEKHAPNSYKKWCLVTWMLGKAVIVRKSNSIYSLLMDNDLSVVGIV